MDEGTKSFACIRCPTVKESNRLPRGWKDYEGPVCEACLKSGFSLRAVTLPVARIVGRIDAERDDPEPVEGFLRHFLPAWEQARTLANWAMQELVRRDVRRTPGMTTLPKYDPAKMFGTFPRTTPRKGSDPTREQVGTLYSTWNAITPVEWRQIWDGVAGSAGAILKDVEDDWKMHTSFGRFAVLWQGKARPMVFAQYPWPVRQNDWRARWGKAPGGDVPLLSVPVPGGNRLLLELDRSPELRGQLNDFDALVTGAAHGADVKLTPLSRGGRVVGVKAVIAGRFPRTVAVGEPDRFATIRTGPDALMTIEVPKRPPFILYAAHLKGVLACYEKWLERYRTDLKYEKRWPAQKRRRMVEKCQPRIDRHKGRIDSELKQACAAVIGFVARQKCSAVVYDDTNHDFLASWPWYAMRERLSCLCGELGIGFRVRPSEEFEVGDAV